MNQRPSLLDQAGISDAPATKKSSSRGARGMDAERTKLVAAIVLLVLAAVGIAWGLGLFAGGPPKVDPDEHAAREQRYEEQVKKEEERVKRLPEPPVEAGG